MSSDEFERNLACAFDEAIRCATFDDHAAALNPTKFTEPRANAAIRGRSTGSTFGPKYPIVGSLLVAGFNQFERIG